MEASHIGGIVAPSPAAWVSSKRHLVIPFGRILRVFDITVDQPTCTACLRGHSAAVVAVVPAGNMRVASASCDGTVRLWDVDDGSCLRTVDVGQPVFQMCRSSGGKLLVLCARKLLMLSLEKNAKTRFPKLLDNFTFDAECGRIASSADGSLIAVVDKNTLFMSSAAKGFNPVLIVTHYSWLTSVAINAEGSMLAVGDEKGAIFVYTAPTSLFPQSNKTVRLNRSQTLASTLHWHSSAVCDMTFSADGKVLISGGNEAVLVSWKLTKSNFGTRTFLPRLRASIKAISLSSDESICAVTQADNSVRLVDQAGGTVQKLIRGIGAESSGVKSPLPNRPGLPPYMSGIDNTSTRVIRLPRYPGRVLLYGNARHLQLFDIYGGQHIRDVTIMPGNTVRDPAKLQTKPDHPGVAAVTAVCLSASGTRMATIDQQRFFVADAEGRSFEESVETLRMWDTDTACDKSSLSAVFVQPHGGNKDISSICFHPCLPIAVSSSSSGTLRIWRELIKAGPATSATWRRELDLSYKGLPCQAICFSDDGSLLAAGFGSTLVLWHFEDLLSTVRASLGGRQEEHVGPGLNDPCSVHVEFLHTLVHPPSEEIIRMVSFIQAEVPLFVACTEAGVYLWNALTQGIWWSSRLRTKPECSAVLSEAGLFALAVLVPGPGLVDEDSIVEEDEHGSAGETVAPDHQNYCEVGATDTPAQSVCLADRNRCTPSEAESLKRVPRRKRSASAKRSSRNRDRSDRKSSEQKLPIYTDSAVAMFNVASPVPLWVSRLPSGVSVSSLEFCRSCAEDSDSNAQLVCVDSSMNVSCYGAHEGDNISMVTNQSSLDTEGAKPYSSRLEALTGGYGIHSFDDSSAGERIDQMPNKVSLKQLPKLSAETAHASIAERKVTSALGTFFDGPVHIQAPVSLKSYDFIQAILNNTGDELLVSRDAPEDVDSLHLPDHTDGTMNAEVDPPRPDEFDVDEFEACRSFCRKFIESYSRSNNISAD